VVDDVSWEDFSRISKFGFGAFLSLYSTVPEPHLPARSFARYKDALVPAVFPTTLSLSFVLFPSPTFLHRPLVPQAAPSSTYSLPGPLVPTEPIRRGQWEKCRSATADSYSLDASATLSRRPSDPSTPDGDAGEAPGVPAGHRRLGHATALGAGLPHFKLRPPIHEDLDYDFCVQVVE
jgi:hypothetical protein